MSKRLNILLVICLIALATVLRLHKYAEFPVVGETADEYAWTMLGASLIEDGNPASWSYFGAYDDHQVNEVEMYSPQTKSRFPIVRPVFDHPPLFGFLPGLAQSVRGNWTEVPSAKVMRLPVLLLGVVNVVLLYLVSRFFFKNTYLQFVPALVYATAPMFVFSSRLVVAENLIVTWVLLAIYALAGMKQTRKQFILLTIISAAAILTKMSGVIVPLAIIAYGISRKEQAWKAGILGLLSGALLFIGYGAYFNWQLFVEVFSTQASRNLGLLTLHNRLLLHPAIADKYYVDGWLITGLIAMGVAFFKAPQTFLSAKLLFIMNLLFVLFFVGEQTLHGWYDFPMFPILCLGVGFLVQEIITEKNYLLLGLVWILLLPVVRYALMTVGLYDALSPWTLRAVMIIGFIPWGLQQIRLRQLFVQYALGFVLLLIVTANVASVLTFQKEIYWGTDDYLYYRGYIYPDNPKTN